MDGAAQRSAGGKFLAKTREICDKSDMKHCRKYADYARFFTDAHYVAKRVDSIREKAVELADGCVVLPQSHKGYALASFGGRMWHAHRLLWIIAHGDIGELVVDHKCRNRACINPEHLEPVTNAANVQRGFDARRSNTRLSNRCHKGHPLEMNCQGDRFCRTCKNDRYRNRRRADPEFRKREQARRNRNYALAKKA